MDRLETMRLFTRVVETASFSKAAKAEGVAQSTVSKQIAALEERLGVQLLRRSSRRLQVTEAGQEVYDFYAGILTNLEHFEATSKDLQAIPSGRVRVALPPGLAGLYVKRLAQFFAMYPKVMVDLIVSEKFVNLIEEGIDLAIRIGEQADSALTTRRIGSVEQITVATPAYLARHGTPQTPDHIKNHTCVMAIFEGGTKSWRFRGPAEPLIITPTGWVRTNDPEHMREAVLADLGIAHCPGWLFAEEIEKGKVVRILKEFSPAPFPISAAYPATHMPNRVRVLVDFFAQVMGETPHARIR
jgi:LysR family transcriptional regulator for bpeEF and oprC